MNKPTTDLLIAVGESTWEKALNFLRRNEDWNGNQLIEEALNRFLNTEARGTVEIPLELLTDLLQMCVWLRLMNTADCGQLDLKTYAEQAGLVETWGREFCVVSRVAGDRGGES